MKVFLVPDACTPDGFRHIHFQELGLPCLPNFKLDTEKKRFITPLTECKTNDQKKLTFAQLMKKCGFENFKSDLDFLVAMKTTQKMRRSDYKIQCIAREEIKKELANTPSTRFFGFSINTKKIDDLKKRLSQLNFDIMNMEYNMENERIHHLILREYFGDEVYQSVNSKY